MQNEATKMQSSKVVWWCGKCECRLMDVDFTNSNGKNMQASVKDAAHREKLLSISDFKR